MTLIVVALLAAALIIVIPTWKRFLTYLELTPAESWRLVMISSAFCVGPPVLIIVASWISLMIASETWYYRYPDVLILMMLALTLPVYFYIIPRGIFRELRNAKVMTTRIRRTGKSLGMRQFVITIYVSILARRTWNVIRWKKKRKVKKQPDLSKEVGAISALICFLLTIWLSLFVIIAAIQVAVGVNIGGASQRDDFEFARAMIIAMPITFACGIGYLGLSYSVELSEKMADLKK